MSSDRFLKAASFALLALFVVPMANAASDGHVDYTSKAQDDQIVKDYGSGAPYGEWQKVNTDYVTWYLHSGCPTTGNNQGVATATEGAGTAASAACSQGGLGGPGGTTSSHFMDTQVPTTGFNAMQMTSGETAYFPTGVTRCIGAFQVKDDMYVTGFEGAIWLQGDRITSEHVRYQVQRYDASCAAYPADATVPTVGNPYPSFELATSTSQTNGIEGKFSGSYTFPNLPGQEHGTFLKKGDYLVLTVTLVPGTVCAGVCVTPQERAVLKFDGPSYPAYLKVTGDSDRMNMWTADRFGQVTDNFPHAATASVADRKVSFNAVEFNTWGHDETCSGPSAPFKDRRANECVQDNLEEKAMRIRVKDVDNTHTAANGYCGGAKGGACYNKYIGLDLGFGLQNLDGGYSDSYIGCCNMVTRFRIEAASAFAPTPPATTADGPQGLQRYHYNLAYDDTFPDGKYQIEFQQSDKLWTYGLGFTVGLTGYTFKFAPFESVVSTDGTIDDHLVAVKEPTKYSVIVRNDGVNTDTYGLSVPVPGLGWTATFSPATVTLAPKQETQVDVIVTPSASALPGDIKVVSITATSLHDASTKTLYTRTTLTAQTECTKGTGCIVLSSPMKALQTRPQVTSNFPVQVFNNGTVHDSFIVTPSGMPVATDASAGWVVNISPSFLPVYAASRETVIVKVTAPANAVPGSSFTLQLKACRTVDAHVCSEILPIPVTIYLIDDLKVSVLNDHIIFRDAEQDRVDTTSDAHYQRDRLFDDGTVYRLLVENTGDRTDKIELTGAWDRNQVGGARYLDRNDCEIGTNDGVHDGVPDGWRFKLLSGAPADPGPLVPNPTSTPSARIVVATSAGPGGGAAFSGSWSNPQAGGAGATGSVAGTAYAGDYLMGYITLPAHTSQWVFVDVWWVAPVGGADSSGNGSGCLPEPLYATGDPYNFRTGMPSEFATLRVSYRSGNEEALRGSMLLTSELKSGTRAATIGVDGKDAGTLHKVKLERAIGQSDIGYAPIGSSTAPYATYNFVATNLGEEVDTLKINVDDGHNGWKHTILAVPNPVQNTGIVQTGFPSQPTAAPARVARGPCTITDPSTASPPNNKEQNMRCPNIGVYDTVYFQVRATPPAGKVFVGDSDDMAIEVTSDAASSSTIFDRQTVRTIVQGLYGFTLENLNTNLQAYDTQTIAFPFTIHNVGTSGDRYVVSIDPSTDDQAWNPELSSGQVVAVPAGYDFHGFLSVTVPSDEPQTFLAADAKHFRVNVQSIDSGSGATKVLDFFATIVPDNGLRLDADPVTIAGLTSDRIRIAADATNSDSGSPTQILFDGYFTNALNQLPSLPRGFKFVCLPSNHPHYDVDRKCGDPPGAGQTPPYQVQPQFDSSGKAIQQLEVSVPAQQLGTSRIAHRIQGRLPDGTTVYTDAIINMASVYGVKLSELTDQTTRIVAPGNLAGATTSGATVIYNVVVENVGLTPQSVLLTNSDLPEGWQIFYDTVAAEVQPPGYALVNGAADCQVTADPCKNVDPASRTIIQVGLRAPDTARPGDEATILIFGTVQQDTTQVAQLELKAVVGSYGVKVTATPTTYWVAPEEIARLKVNVENSGDLPDTFVVSAVLPPTYANSFPFQWSSGCTSVQPQPLPSTLSDCLVTLQPGQSQDIGLDVATPSQAAPTGTNPGYQVSVTAHAALSPKTSAVSVATVKILDYEWADVDADLLAEYAVDGCTVSQDEGCAPDASDGYETFRESAGAGVVTRDALLANYVLAAYRDDPLLSPCLAHNATGGFAFPLVDADGDCKVDHLLDTDGDGLPDVLWLPKAGHTGVVQMLNFTRDVTSDNLAEYFIDLDRDGTWDVVYDLARGRFVKLIHTYADSDGIYDYGVDVNGNGVIDQDETLLFGGAGGKIVTVQFSRLIDGDDVLDKAFDTNGDGCPESFLPGKNPQFSVTIQCRDVLGAQDGHKQWTYDHTGQNGKPDSYYDPVTGERGLIDTKGEFLRDLQKYWWIMALFAMALALFVTLVLVTRRK